MGVMKGAWLGLVNTIVIAAAIAMSGAAMGFGDDDEPRREVGIGVFVMVMIYGCVPGMVLGGVMGRIASVLRVRPALRAAILLVPAVALVVGLGRLFALGELILPACIPTVASVLLLERSTRPASSFPAARVA